MKRATRQRVFATANSVLAAARDSGLDDADFRQVGAAKAAALVARLRETFTQGAMSRGDEPLWTKLRGRALPAAEPHQLSDLLRLGPAAAPVFLFVEDWAGTKRREPLWVFETTLAGAIAALDNHPLLEYYLVPRSFEWLVAENEHNVLFVIGDDAVAEIARVRG